MEFDQPIHGLGSAVGGAAGVEVGQEGVLPLLQRPAEAGDFGDGAGREAVDDLFGELAALGRVGVGVGGADALGALPGGYCAQVEPVFRCVVSQCSGGW